MIRITSLAALLCVAPLAGAQGENDTPAAPAKNTGPAVVLKLNSLTSYAFETDGDAEFSVFRAGGDATLEWAATDALSTSFTIGYEYSTYDFQNTSDFIPDIDEDDPFDEFHAISFLASGGYRLNTSWSVFLGGFARAGWEIGAKTSDAWTGGGFGVVNYRLDENLTLGFGVGASSQLEDDAFVFPVITADWQINDRLRFQTKRLGGRLTYSLADDFDLYGRVEYLRRQYRLDDHPTIGDGVFRDERVPIGVGIEWRPIEGMTVGFEAGAMVYTELRFYDDGDDTVAKPDADPTPYISLSLQYTF